MPTLEGSGLIHNHNTKLKKLVRHKHSSLVQTFVNYGSKKFYNIGMWGAENKIKYTQDPGLAPQPVEKSVLGQPFFNPSNISKDFKYWTWLTL